MNKENALNITNMTPETAQNLKLWNKPATAELKEAVLQTAEQTLGLERDLVDLTTAATPADIAETLFMKVMDGKLYTPEYKFYLAELYTKKIVSLGNSEYKYAELEGTSDTLGIQAANSIDDFNGDYIPEYAELYKLNDEFHKKVKLPELVLSNAWLAASQMVEFVQLQVEEMTYAIERRWENLAWTTTFEEATSLEVANGSEAIDFSKALAAQMAEYTTTSDEHFGIGTDGVISVSTVTGVKQIQPDLRFKASDFTVFVDTEQMVDETFTNEAQWFNYLATKVGFAKVIPMKFSKYKGFKAIKDATGAEVKPAVVVPEGLKMIAIHNESIELLEQYTYLSNVDGRGPWTIKHAHKNLGSYRIKTRPIITVVEAPVAPAKKA